VAGDLLAKDLQGPGRLPTPHRTDWLGPALPKTGRMRNNGIPVRIRKILPSDEPLLVTFHRGLSDQSVYRRYFHMEGFGARTSHEQLVRECLIDFANTAFVAERISTDSANCEILAVADLDRIGKSRKAEIGLLVGDRYQHQGLGTKLLCSVIEEAQRQGFEEIVAHILSDNLPMIGLAKSFGFAVCDTEDPTVLLATLNLRSYKCVAETISNPRPPLHDQRSRC